jgi:hypothetical protein
MTSPYPNLLSPLDLGFTTLRNRWSWVRCTPDWKTGPVISIGSPNTSPNAHAEASG